MMFCNIAVKVCKFTMIFCNIAVKVCKFAGFFFAEVAMGVFWVLVWFQLSRK